MREFIRRLLDRKRCRYDDCPEQHPTTNGWVTCPTCRIYLGLPPARKGIGA